MRLQTAHFAAFTALSWLLQPVIAQPAAIIPPAALKAPKAAPEDDEHGDDLSTANKADYASIVLPDPLTADTFLSSTSQKLTLVEFFSPYCSHCKQLAPIWEKTYKMYYQQMEELGIQMRQVNCIESSDLCEREQITSYPNLVLYSPIKDQPGQLKVVDQFPRSVKRTPDNFFRFLKNSVAEYSEGVSALPSSSRLLNVDDMKKLVAGEMDVPHFVVFYPATNEQYEAADKNMPRSFPGYCPDCLDAKRTWDNLSNRILSVAQTGHFNCLSNPAMCEKLEFLDLAAPSKKLLEPRFVVFLPKETGLIRVDYTGEVILREMKHFVTKLFQNSQYERVSWAELTDVMLLQKSLPFEALKVDLPLANKVSVVFYYDVDTVTEEDRAILPHLLDWVTNAPFDMYLYSAKHTKFTPNMETQAQNLVEYINYEDKPEGKPPTYQFDRPMYLASAMTSKPTILIFKEDSLMPVVYQSFSPEAIRNTDRVEEFLKENWFPLQQELTSSMFKHYFDAKHEGDSKVVVAFIDSSDAMATNEAFYSMLLAAHEYHFRRKLHYYNGLMKASDEKASQVDRLNEAKAELVAVINEMKEKIPQFWHESQVLFTYVDLAKASNMVDMYGWNVDGRKYVAGDAIVVAKNNKQYWDKGTDGELLKNDAYHLRLLLGSLLSPTLAPSGLVVEAKTVGRPFGALFRFMDPVHKNGFMGYVFVAALFVMFLVVLRKFARNKRASGNKGAILGNFPAKKD